MKTVEQALEDAGYIYIRDYMQPEFDYPLDVWMRKSDDEWILGDLTHTPNGTRILMNPWDTWHERWVHVHADCGDLVKWFVETFEHLKRLDMA